MNEVAQVPSPLDDLNKIISDFERVYNDIDKAAQRGAPIFSLLAMTMSEFQAAIQYLRVLQRRFAPDTCPPAIEGPQLGELRSVMAKHLEAFAKKIKQPGEN